MFPIVALLKFAGSLRCRLCFSPPPFFFQLADFGCALVLKDDNGDGVEMSMKGTPLFMAPEMLLKRKCGKRVDVWSLGCAVLEMVTTRPPWADTFKHPVEIIEHFSENPGPPPLPEENISPPLRDFLLSCFTWDAAKRPTSHELGGHEYLRTPRAEDCNGGDGGSPGGGGSGSGGGDDNEIPLEAMGRAPFMSRMRRCSSATLPDLLSRSQVLRGADAFGASGTAPWGTLRPPSPRYGPGSIAVHNKRTPTRRRVYTEVTMPPPEGRGLIRRSSMPATRSPPISPEKPKRPGRGSSPGRGTSPSNRRAAEEEGSMESGPVMHARLRSRGDGIDGISSTVICGGMSRGVSSSGSGGRTDTEASVSRSSSMGAGAGAPPTASAAEGPRQAAPTPILPPVVRELLGTLEHGGGGGAQGPAMCVFHAGDTPPPTVRPLKLHRSGSAQARSWGGGGGSVSEQDAQLQRDEEAGVSGNSSEIWMASAAERGEELSDVPGSGSAGGAGGLGSRP